MQARLILIVERLSARQSERVFFGFHAKRIGPHARKLDDGDEVMALLKKVDGRERPDPGGRTAQPIAGEPRIQSALEPEQRIERVHTNHVSTSIAVSAVVDLVLVLSLQEQRSKDLSRSSQVLAMPAHPESATIMSRKRNRPT